MMNPDEMGQFPPASYLATENTRTYVALVQATGLAERDMAYFLGVTEQTVRNRLQGRVSVSHEAIAALKWLMHEKAEGE